MDSRVSAPVALRPLADEPLTDDERARFLAVLRGQPRVGNKAALRQVGVRATKGEIEDLFAAEPDLEDDVLEARGRPVEKVVAALYQTATDPDSPSQTRAAGMYLARYGDPGWRRSLARVDVEHQISGRIEIEDRSASLAEVAEVLVRVGALAALAGAENGGGAAHRHLPALGAVLPAPADG